MRGVFNVGSGRGSTILNLAHAFAQLAPDGPQRIRVHADEVGEAGFTDGFDALDISKAIEHLGLVPIPLASGLRILLAEHEDD